MFSYGKLYNSDDNCLFVCVGVILWIEIFFEHLVAMKRCLQGTSSRCVKLTLSDIIVICPVVVRSL